MTPSERSWWRVAGLQATRVRATFHRRQPTAGSPAPTVSRSNATRGCGSPPTAPRSRASRTGFMPATWPGRALTRQFFAAPRGAEVCGPTLTPDDRTLILAIQHPGEGKARATKRRLLAGPTSRMACRRGLRWLSSPRRMVDRSGHRNSRAPSTALRKFEGG